MDAFIYQADVYCTACAEAIRGDIIQGGGRSAQEDSNGGGEADTPQHCGQCGEFLENPLTPDGYGYVWNALAEHARGDGGDAVTLETWADYYGLEYIAPQSVSFEDLQAEYSLLDDTREDAVSVWFDIAGELYTRGEPIPDEWRYKPGLSPINCDSMMALTVAGASTVILRMFAEHVAADVHRHDNPEDEE